MTAAHTPRIVTDFTYPPIPLRQFDWLAWFDGQEDGLQGTGPTEQEAIDDLLEQVDNDELTGPDGQFGMGA